MEYKINLDRDWTPETFAEEMLKIKEHYRDDPEDCHWVMDAVMVYVLTQLGYGEGAQVFVGTTQWYT